MALVALSLAGCAAGAAEYRREALASDDPEDLVAHAWEWEITDPSDREITEEEIKNDIDSGIARWPEDWRFRAFKASHLVRVGDL